MKRMRKFCLGIFLVAFVFGNSCSMLAQHEITLLAVGPMRAPTQKIVANFEAKTGYKVKVTYGNGLETRQMVAKGQPLDVSLLITPFPGAIASGTIIPGSATTVASILTAVAVPKGRPKPDISTPAAFRLSSFRSFEHCLQPVGHVVERLRNGVPDLISWNPAHIAWREHVCGS